jgi:hypothetical protein
MVWNVLLYGSDCYTWQDGGLDQAALVNDYGTLRQVLLPYSGSAAMVDTLLSDEKDFDAQEYSCDPRLFETLSASAYGEGMIAPVPFSKRFQMARFLRRRAFEDSAHQFAALREGFLSVVCPRPLEMGHTLDATLGCAGLAPGARLGGSLLLLTAEELGTKVCGNRDIDLALLKQHTSYASPLSLEHPLVQRFWTVLEEFSPKNRQRFVQFAWARSTLPPAEDFNTSLQLSVAPPEGKDSKGKPVGMGDGHLPKSMTCFFSVTLPNYSSLEVMRAKLTACLDSSALSQD